jgi:glutathione S-transferase
MFAQPRPKKNLLPPPPKRRKTESAIEEISFDNDARHEFLTGFHKRKLQRVKHAQEEAAKKARQERLETRRQVSSSRLASHSLVVDAEQDASSYEPTAVEMRKSMSQKSIRCFAIQAQL